MSAEREPPVYLGDGVYATFDGWHIWLRAEGPNAGTENRIALEPAVFEALLEYRRKLVAAAEERYTEADDDADSERTQRADHDHDAAKDRDVRGES